MNKASKYPVTNITASICGGGAVIECEYRGARYHVWLDEKSNPLEPIYKNALRDAVRADQTPTRRLLLDGAIGRVIIPAILAQRDRLVGEARRVFDEAMAAAQRKAEAEQRTARIEAAGPELLAALEDLLAFSEPDSLIDQRSDARLRLDAAAARDRAQRLIVRVRA